MENKEYITKTFIGKEELKDMLKEANLKYESGGEYEDELFWVVDDNDKTLLKIHVNNVDENGFCSWEHEMLEEYTKCDITLPEGYNHNLVVGYRDYNTVKILEKVIKKHYPEALRFDDYDLIFTEFNGEGEDRVFEFDDDEDGFILIRLLKRLFKR